MRKESLVARRRRGRKVDGILVLDKPQGISSNDAVQQAKRLFGAQKVGHTGSLDPLATGVLPLCFGEATKFSQFLLSSDKKYWVRIRLGVATESGDADGGVIAEKDASGVTADDVEALLPQFRGEISQVPSMYSALKHNGQPLYKLARQGIEVERKPRCVRIFSNELVGFAENEVELEIHCSKGTYVRSIAEDLGELLDVGAHVVALRRLAAGPYQEADVVTLDHLEAQRELDPSSSLDKFLQPTASAVGQWPELRLSESLSFYLRQGQPVLVPHAPTSGWVRLSEASGEEGNFIGVGEVLDDGRIAPRRLVVNS
ncbi:MAG: tRNA pseudouridine(55) synthase TruB [Pseudomonadales bacterium]